MLQKGVLLKFKRGTACGLRARHCKTAAAILRRADADFTREFEITVERGCGRSRAGVFYLASSRRSCGRANDPAYYSFSLLYGGGLVRKFILFAFNAPRIRISYVIRNSRR